MDENGFIKLHRSLLNWEHFSKSITFHVFLYLILKANYKPTKNGELLINRGQLLTNYSEVCKKTSTSYQQVRTAISNMKATGEITVSQHGKKLLITVVNYDKYQTEATGTTTEKQPVENMLTKKNQHDAIHYKRNKEVRSARARETLLCLGRFENILLTQDEYDAFCEERPSDGLQLIEQASLKLKESEKTVSNAYATLLRFAAKKDEYDPPVEKKYKRLVVPPDAE